MTTGNQVITQTFNDVLFIPLETVFAGADSIPFVYKKDGTRQIVVLGESNENDVIVEQGLEKGERLYLTIPEGGDKYKRVGEELIAVIKEHKAKKAEEERRLQMENQRANQSPGMDSEKMREFMQNLTPEQREAMRKLRGGTGTGAAGGRQRGTGSDSTRSQTQGTQTQGTQTQQVRINRN
jgi:hypothetical protein